jgi:methylmalonyl-CoA/ethylmalonyl-CoA epimerase
VSIIGLEDAVLDHVAIAVNDLDTAVARYELLGLKFSKERETVASQKVQTAFASLDSTTNDHAGHLELLQTTEPDGPIGKFIEKNGEGIHHLCFQVKDIRKKQLELEKKGIRFIKDEPFQGANNCLVNFIHPKSMGGVLIELSEKGQGV